MYCLTAQTQQSGRVVLGCVAAFIRAHFLAVDRHERVWAVALAAGGGAGFLRALLVGFLTLHLRPYTLIAVTDGPFTAAYLLPIDADNGRNVVPTDTQRARQEFVVAFVLLFALVCCSSSKSIALEAHRMRCVVFSALTGGAGWRLTASRGSWTRALSSQTRPSSRSSAVALLRSGVWTQTRRRSCMSCGLPPSLAFAVLLECWNIGNGFKGT